MVILEITSFPKLHSSYPLINAVLSREQEGKIYYNDSDNSYFILHKSAFSEFAGTKTGNFLTYLNFLVNTTEIPTYFHVYDAPDKLIEVCQDAVDKVNVKLRHRVQLQFSENSLSLASAKLPAGFAISAITDRNFESVSHFELSIESKFWKSKTDFLNNGFGFVVITDSGKSASICYSACVSKGTAEIDVATTPGFQKMGLAKLVVGRFVEHCLEHGIAANWDCFEDNYASLRTAESIGFRRLKTYQFLSIFNKTRQS